MMNEHLNRRNVLTAGGALAATTVMSQVAQADTHDAHSGHMMGGMHKNQTVIDTAMSCIINGNICLDHCMILFTENDTSVAECANQVTLMLPICDLLMKYALADTSYLKQIAAVCIDVCSECERECRKHADKHAQCKACAESCAECIKACKALIAA